MSFVSLALFVTSSSINPCPYNYVLVGSNREYGITNSFCIAKYEVRQMGTRAISTMEGKPWTNVTYRQALLGCRLNGDNFDLITNAEWQVTAREIEDTSWNWNWNFDESLTDERISQGLSFGTEDQAPKEASEDRTPCHGTGFNCGLYTWHKSKRVHRLESGMYLWDFAGNVWEWVKGKVRSGSPDSYAYNLSSPFLRKNFGTKVSYGSDMGLGYYWDDGFGVERTPVRGGDFSSMNRGGIFATRLFHSQKDRSKIVGFRCVYHFDF